MTEFSNNRSSGEIMLGHRKTILLSLLLLVAPLVTSGMIPDIQAQVQPVHDVAVSVASLAGIVEDIGGPLVRVSILMEQEADPHSFTINPAVLAIANAADLLVFTGHFHFEESIANETATPFITLHDEAAWESYEAYGAALSPMPGGIELGDHEGNPHAYWLLPRNAIAIANATRAALSTLNATLSETWNSNFESFIQKMDDLQALIDSLDEASHFSEMRAVVVFPAEAYVAEAFGIQCVAVLVVESITISGATLLEVQNALRNGTVQLIIGSDVAQFQAGGEFAFQLQADYGATLIWWKTLFFAQSDYISLMTFNLGALVSGLEGRSGVTGIDAVTVGLMVLAATLGIVVAIETTLLILRARAE